MGDIKLKEVSRDRAQLSVDRLRIASEALNNIYSTAYESNLHYFDGAMDQDTCITRMKDWFYRYYELLGNVLWMVRNLMEDETELLDSYLWNEVFEDGKTEEE